MFIVVSIELIFTAWLFLAFGGWKSSQPLQVLYDAVFHTVSAFCNAGFSTMSDSFMQYRENAAVLIPIMLLIVIGGLGFIVILDIGRNIIKRNPARRLGLQSRIVLISSAILLASGFCLYLLLEWQGSMATFSMKERILNSLFHSVTSRTAGFNTIDVARMNPVTQFLTTILMFIGASPGSTGGGIKTCTFVLVIYFVRSIFRHQKNVFIMKRTVPNEIIRDALLIFFIAISWVLFTTSLLAFIEPGKTFISLLFEAVSAFGTVGLSVGVTPLLSTAGKALIIVSMMVGRIGLLVLVLGLAMKRPETPYSYPEEKVMVG